MNYYIKGDAANADKIKAAFKKLGYNSRGLDFFDFSCGFFYTVERDVHYCVSHNCVVNIIKTHPDYKELALPIESKFKVGDWIVGNEGIFKITQYEDEHGYDLTATTGCVVHFVSPDYVESNFHLLSIKDAKQGDVLCTYECGNPKIVFILRGNPEGNCSVLSYYCYYNIMYPHFEPNAERGCLAPKREDVKPATKEQRGLLFKKMKEAGYQWDAEKKELREIIKTKFKAGDEIKTGNTIETITEVDYATRSYCCKSGRAIWFENQDLWHLAPKPHYDISNFKPFDKVLVRCSNDEEWMIEFYCKYDTLVHTSPHRDYPFMGIGDSYSQCIPYNDDTKHLLGTTDMCPEEYINW